MFAGARRKLGRPRRATTFCGVRVDARPACVRTMSAAHEEVLYSDISEKTLHVGDVITLCVQREGKIFCVGSEGFVELGCSLRELDLSTAVPWTFVDCQWVVHVKCQYYAQKRMKKALKRKDGEKAGADAVVVPTAGRRKLSTMASVTLAAQVQDRAAAERQLQADLLTALEVEQASNSAATSRSERAAAQFRPRNSARNSAQFAECKHPPRSGTPVNWRESNCAHQEPQVLAAEPIPRARRGQPGGARRKLGGRLAHTPRFKFQVEGSPVLNRDVLQMRSPSCRTDRHAVRSWASSSSARTTCGRTRRPRATTSTSFVADRSVLHDDDLPRAELRVWASLTDIRDSGTSTREYDDPLGVDLFFYIIVIVGSSAPTPTSCPLNCRPITPLRLPSWW